MQENTAPAEQTTYVLKHPDLTQPEARDEFTALAFSRRNPDNHDNLRKKIPPAILNKLDRRSKSYDPAYDMSQAVLESLLGQNHRLLKAVGRENLVNEINGALLSAGIDLTSHSAPVSDLYKTYLENYYGDAVNFDPAVKRAKRAVQTQAADLKRKAADSRQVLEKLRTPSANTQEKTRQTLQEVKDRALALGSYGKALLEGSKDRRTIDEEIGKLPLEEQVKIQKELINQLAKEAITPAPTTVPTIETAEQELATRPENQAGKRIVRPFSGPNVFSELIQEVKDMPPIATQYEIENGPAFLRRAEQPPSTPSTPLQEPVAPVEPASLAVEQRPQGDIDSTSLESARDIPPDATEEFAEEMLSEALRDSQGYPKEGSAPHESAVQAQEELTERLAEMEERKQRLNPEQDSIKKDVETIAGLALANYEDRLQKLVGLADKKVDIATLESFDAFAAEITEVLENSRAWNKEMHDANLDAVKNALLTDIIHKAPKKTLPDWLDKKDLPDWLFLEEPPPPTPRKLPDWIDLKEPRYVSEDETVQITNNSHEEFSTVQGKVNLRDQSSAVIQSAVGRFWGDESTNITIEDTSMADIQTNNGSLVLTDSSHGFVDNNHWGRANLSGSSSVHISLNENYINDVYISERGSVYIGSGNYSPKIVDDGILFVPPKTSSHQIINLEIVNSTFSLAVPALENDLAVTSDNHRILEISGRTFAVIKAQGIGENEQQKAIAVFEKRMVATENGQEEKYIFLDGRKAEDKTTLIDRLKAKTRLEDISEFESSIASLETQTSSPQPEQNTTSALKPWQMKAEAYAAPNNTTSFEDAKQKLTEHRNLVREALINREDVPLEVLETYPDLANEFGIKLPVSEQIRPQSVGSTVGNPPEEASSYWGDHANAYKGVVRPLRTLAEEELDRLAIEASQVPKKNKNILARIFRR